MDIIKNPKEKEITIKCKSILVSRSSTPQKEEFRTLIIKAFTVNNPHKTTEFPIITYEFSNTEKVRLRNLNVSYYLEGNDIVINDLEEVNLENIKEKNKIILRAKQENIESRE